MATSEWLKELRQAATQGTTPPATIIRQRNVSGASTAPVQATNDAAGETGSHATGAAQNAPQRPQRAFTAPTDATRDYRAMYAALFRFHERHNPPTLGDDDGALYWAATTDEMIAIAQQFNNDPFMMNLLCVVFDELEREYKAMIQHTAGE